MSEAKGQDVITITIEGTPAQFLSLYTSLKTASGKEVSELAATLAGLLKPELEGTSDEPASLVP